MPKSPSSSPRRTPAPRNVDELLEFLHRGVEIKPSWFLSTPLLQSIWDDFPEFAEDWGFPLPSEMEDAIAYYGRAGALQHYSDPRFLPILTYHGIPKNPPPLAWGDTADYYDYRSMYPGTPQISDYNAYREQHYYSENEIKQILTTVTYNEFPQHLKDFIESEFSDIFARYPGLREYVGSLKVDFVPQAKAPGQLAEYLRDENRVEWYSDWEFEARYVNKQYYPTPESVKKHFIDRYINYTISHEIAHAIQNFLNGTEPAVAPYPDEEHPEYREFGDQYKNDPGEQHAREVAERYKEHLLKNPTLIPPRLSWQYQGWEVGDRVTVALDLPTVVTRLQERLGDTIAPFTARRADWDALGEYVLNHTWEIKGVLRGSSELRYVIDLFPMMEVFDVRGQFVGSLYFVLFDRELAAAA